MDIMPSFYYIFNACICGICHRNEENIHTTGDGQFFSCVLSFSFSRSLPLSPPLSHSFSMVKENHVILIILIIIKVQLHVNRECRQELHCSSNIACVITNKLMRSSISASQYTGIQCGQSLADVLRVPVHPETDLMTDIIPPAALDHLMMTTIQYL